MHREINEARRGLVSLTAQLVLVLRDLLSADLHFGRPREKVCRIDEENAPSGSSLQAPTVLNAGRHVMS